MHNTSYPDRLYYNVALANNETREGPTLASYKNVLNQNLIDDPSKYYLTVLRFQIPTADIPILIPEIKSFPNTNVNLTEYTVTLQYQAFSFTAPVIFETENPNSLPRPITASNPNPMIQPDSYYFVYNYRHFILLVNNALTTAYNGLNALTGGILVAGPPFLTFDSVTLLITLHCPTDYLSSLANPINIFMNYKMFTFFEGIESYFYNYLSDTGVQIRVIDTGVNFSAGIYFMIQQYVTVSTWNVFKSIQIVSAMLPVANEIVPIPSYLDQNNYNSLSVVKDFVPFYENGPEFRTFINFSNVGQYELINMNSNAPISTVDISVYWLDRYGNRYLVSIPYNQILTIKFAFIRKDTYAG